jgi:DNA-directed RNA polymerase specialized sigma24 family protein
MTELQVSKATSGRRTTPPFRADHVGSLLRPPNLLEARAAFAAVAELSPRLRETIVAVDVMGLSYKEAARVLRVRKGTIMSRLHRARDAVADALEGAPA